MKRISVTEMKNHARRLWNSAQSHDFPITYYDNAIMNYILDVIVLDKLPKKYETMTTGEILDGLRRGRLLLSLARRKSASLQKEVLSGIHSSDLELIY